MIASLEFLTAFGAGPSRHVHRIPNREAGGEGARRCWIIVLTTAELWCFTFFSSRGQRKVTKSSVADDGDGSWKR